MEQAYYKDGTVQQMAPPYSPGPQHAQTVYYYPSSAHTGQQMQYAVPQQPQTVYAGQYAQQPQPQFVQGTYMAQPMAAAAPVAPNPALGALLMNNLMSHRCDPGQHIYKTEVRAWDKRNEK